MTKHEIKEEVKKEEIAIAQAATNNAVMDITDDSGEYELFGEMQRKMFSSIKPQTQAEKVLFYNAINSPTDRLGDFINIEVSIQHVYAEECQYISKETGEVVPGVRIVLMSPDGKSYNTSSKGVFNSLTKIFKIFGHPATWTEPVKVRVKQLTPSENRRVLTLEMV